MPKTEPDPDDGPVELPSPQEVQLRKHRRQRLTRLGFGGAVLDVLADHADVHQAEALIAAGCPVDVAARILI